MTSESLADKARKGLLWNGGFKVCHVLIQFALTIVLARLLVPEEYGVYAVAASIMAFLNAVSAENFLGQIVQVRDEREVHYDQQFTAAVAIQSVIFVLTNAVALSLRAVAGYDSVGQALHVLSPVLLFSAVSGFRNKTLERELDWRRSRMLLLIGIVLSACAAVAMAGAGAGVYALLVAPYFKYVPYVVDLFLVERWHPRWTWSADAYGPTFRFGLNRVGSSAVATSKPALEANVLAGTVGLARVGEFGRAIGLARMTCGQLSAVLMQSIYPALTRLPPSSPAYVRASRVLLRAATWTAVPAAVTVSLLAEPVVRAVYGERWMVIVPLVPWAMAVGGFAAVSQCCYHLLLGNHGQRACFAYDVIGLVGAGSALAIVAALGAGLEAYAAALSVMEAAGLIFLLLTLVRAGAIDLAGLRSAILDPLVATSVAIGCAELATNVIGFKTSTAVSACVYGAILSAAYLATLRVFSASALADLVNRLPASRTVARLLLFKYPVAA